MRKGLTNIQWCAGCGDTLLIMAIKNVFKELEIESHNRVVVTGIGCSGKSSQYIDGYAAETLHWRWVPFATWIKMANPEMTVLAISGDGDGLGIGMGHFIHACRRNLDMTYLIFNNENYALTTGQASATTPIWAKTKTTPEGNVTTPFDALTLAEASGCKFIKRATTDDFKQLKVIIKEAIEYKGFSVVDIAQACPSFKRW